jgi:hypothetical protein
MTCIDYISCGVLHSVAADTGDNALTLPVLDRYMRAYCVSQVHIFFRGSNREHPKIL